MATYRRGSKGTDIETLQLRLIDLGYLDIGYITKTGDAERNADGDFGGLTETAVKAFKVANHLPVTGVLTEADIDKLNSNEAIPASQAAAAAPAAATTASAAASVSVNAVVKPAHYATNARVDYKDNKFIYRGNETEFDTIDSIARAALMVNGHPHPTNAQVLKARKDIITSNHLKTKDGRDCDGSALLIPNIHPGSLLDLSVVGPNKIQHLALVHKKDCTDCIGTPEIAVAATAEVPSPPPPLPPRPMQKWHR